MFSRMRLHRDERGISTVIVAVSLVGLIGAVMISLDYGNMVSTRRNIIIGTDSTSLDQAKSLALSSNANPTCAPTWTDYLLRNSGGGLGVTPVSCDVVANSDGTGYVIVRARKEAQTRLGGLFNIGNTHPYSLSAAQWGFINQAEGLRPMGICAVNHHIQEWLAFKNGSMSQSQYNGLRGNPASEHPVYSGAGVVHRVMFTKDNPNDCGGDAPGNWGWMDFECNNDGDTPSSLCGNSNDELRDLIRYGYQELVGIGDCDADADEPGGESGDYCNGETGSSGGSVADALDFLVTNQIKFAIPVFDTATETGNNVYFNMRYFVGVILRGYRVTGAEASRYFDFEFVDLVTSGNCCTPRPAQDTGLRGVKLCAVDHDTAYPGQSENQFVAARCQATT